MVRYVTGLHALNLGDRSVTGGDWHYSSMDCRHPMLLDTETSPFGTWDVSEGSVPGMGRMPVAGHVRACLDLVEQGMYGAARGIRDQYLGNPKTAPAFMRQI